MTTTEDKAIKVRDLRARAEKQVTRNSTRNISTLSLNNISVLIHELETHQIELEMQNDELRKAQDALLEIHEKYTELYDFSPIAYLTANEQGLIVYSNITFSKMLGVPRLQLQNQLLSRFIASDDQDIYYLYRKKALQTRERQCCELRLLTPSGDLIWVRMDNFYAEKTDQESCQFRIVLSDISERKQREGEIKRFLLALESSSSAVILTDLNGIIEYVNPSFTKMSGYGKEEAIGEKASILKSGQTPEKIYKKLWQDITSGKDWKGEFHECKKDGSFYRVRSAITAVKDETGVTTSYMCVQDDVTEEYELTMKLGFEASHDALTGLINRREFERRANRLLSTIQQEHQQHALCFMDLDQFKVINDTSGHMAGDELLRQLGHVLQSVVRNRDTLARLGGDEFGVLMEHCTPDQAYRVANALQKAINDFQFIWEHRSYRVGISIGLVAISQSSTDLTELIRQADSACYMAKELGRNRIHVYQREDAVLALRYGQMLWVSKINQALDEGRFALYAQPIASLDLAKPKQHYELLLRLVSEKGEIIPPSHFLPAAERYDLIGKLDEWVIHEVFNLLAAHPAFVEQIQFLSINLSGKSVTSSKFLESIVFQLKASQINPSKICFEITETVAISNLNAARDFILMLKQIGCRFALDDFGSGLSSFGYLKNLPVNYLKIDGMFVKGMVDDPIDYAMVKSINDIGQVMGKKTIAEFVENDETIEQLKKIGVNYAQGYVIDKPKPLIEILEQSRVKSECQASLPALSI